MYMQLLDEIMLTILLWLLYMLAGIMARTSFTSVSIMRLLCYDCYLVPRPTEDYYV